MSQLIRDAVQTPRQPLTRFCHAQLSLQLSENPKTTSLLSFELDASATSHYLVMNRITTLYDTLHTSLLDRVSPLNPEPTS